MGMPGKELRHQIQLSEAPPQPMEHHGDRGRSHADLVAMARILGIQPGGESDFVADACHDAQVVQAFIDVPICCSHQESSAAVDSALPIFAKPVNQSAECGLGNGGAGGEASCRGAGQASMGACIPRSFSKRLGDDALA
jgi:hypothetical protein